MQVLTEEEALPILGRLEDAVSIPGFTVILYDSNQFMRACFSFFLFGISNLYPKF